MPFLPQPLSGGFYMYAALCWGREVNLFTFLKGLMKYLGAGRAAERDEELEGASWQDVNGALVCALKTALKRPEEHGTRSNQGSVYSRIPPLTVPRVVAILVHDPGGWFDLQALLSSWVSPSGQQSQPTPYSQPLGDSFQAPVFVPPKQRLSKAAVTYEDRGQWQTALQQEKQVHAFLVLLLLRPFSAECDKAGSSSGLSELRGWCMAAAALQKLNEPMGSSG